MRCFSRLARAAVLSAVAVTVSAGVAPIDRTTVARLKAMAFAGSHGVERVNQDGTLVLRSE